MPLDKENFIIQQFIGLTDKTGREIYEGDIVSTNHFGGRVVGIIEYKKDSFIVVGRYLNQKNSVIKDFDCYGNMRFLEIIGNIFENPELLKKIKKLYEHQPCIN